MFSNFKERISSMQKNIENINFAQKRGHYICLKFRECPSGDKHNRNVMVTNER